MVRNFHLLKLAAKNVLHHYPQSIYFGGVVAVFTLALCAVVINQALDRNDVTEALSLFSGDMSIQRKDGAMIAGWEKLIASQEQYGDVLLSPRLSFTATASYVMSERAVRCIGIDPERDRFVCRTLLSLIPSSERTRSDFFTDFTNTRSCFIGVKVAKSLGVRIGDTVTLRANTGGTVQANAFTVAGVLFSENKIFDDSAIIITLEDAVALSDAIDSDEHTLISRIGVRPKKGHGFFIMQNLNRRLPEVVHAVDSHSIAGKDAGFVFRTRVRSFAAVMLCIAATAAAVLVLAWQHHSNAHVRQAYTQANINVRAVILLERIMTAAAAVTAALIISLPVIIVYSAVSLSGIFLLFVFGIGSASLADLLSRTFTHRSHHGVTA
ncbi:MAG: hypothetical protein HZC28_12190 [Spirochaetes bacterium]|nr:hypothetical protein [Spirochaetota bacterium]